MYFSEEKQRKNYKMSKELCFECKKPLSDGSEVFTCYVCGVFLCCHKCICSHFLPELSKYSSSSKNKNLLKAQNKFVNLYRKLAVENHNGIIISKLKTKKVSKLK